jgi:FixJ family two-component response regulator
MLPLVALVEDDPATRTALSRLLRASGFNTALYESAEAFLAAPPATRPVCLVVDVMLGGMSGLDLQRRLQTLEIHHPVIILTGLDDERVRRQALALGCTAFLQKNCDGETLLAAIRGLAAVDTVRATSS